MPSRSDGGARGLFRARAKNVSERPYRLEIGLANRVPCTPEESE
jgi:hypothetical protein